MRSFSICRPLWHEEYPVPGAASFLEDLIDACVMESYFREHLLQRDLLFHDTLAPHLAGYASETSGAQQRDFLSHVLIALHRPDAAALPNRSLMVAYLEQWLNGLVYELFFPGELHRRNLHLFTTTARLSLPAPDAPGYLGDLAAVFTRAHDLKHPLRAMLADLQTIEEVRIIEGGK